MPIYRIPLALFALVLLSAVAARGHSGAVALARPLAEIVVDGDLSDWPEGLETYPINQVVGSDRLKGPADFQGHFRLGYSAAALYVAVEIQDQSIIVDTSGVTLGDWNRLDSCELITRGHHPPLDGTVFHWVFRGVGQRTKRLLPQGGGHIPWSNAQCAVRLSETSRTYEWRLDFAEAGQQPLEAGHLMHLGLRVHDPDADGSISYVKWDNSPFWEDGATIGDLLLVEADHQTGHVVGKLQWAGTKEGIGRTELRVEVGSSDAVWQVTTGRHGRFALDLPPGPFVVEPAELGGDDKQRVGGKISARDTAQVTLDIPIPEGDSVPLGRGKPLWRHFSETEGLPTHHTNRVAADQQGFMWFASRFFGAQGVSRYDGERFVKYPATGVLVGSVVYSIYGDRDGAVWFGSEKGVCRFDGESWTNYTSEDGLVANRVSSIFQDRTGAWWFGTDKGVSRFDGKTWTSFTAADGLAHNYIESIAEDQRGQLWFGTGNGISRFDGRTWRNYGPDDGLPGNLVHDIAMDRDGQLWFGTDKGVSRYDGKAWENYREVEVFANKRIRGIEQGPNGLLWFAVVEMGLVSFDGENFEVFPIEGVHRDLIGSLALDREGNPWVGTWGGASRLEGHALQVFTREEGLISNEVRASLIDREGNLWFSAFPQQGLKDGTPGLHRYDGKTLTRFTSADGLGGGRYDNVLYQASDNTIWLGGGNSRGPLLYRYDGRYFTRYTSEDGLSPSRIITIIEDNGGDLWFNSEIPIFNRYDGQSFSAIADLDSLGGDFSHSVGKDRDGNLWYGLTTTNKRKLGLARYDGRGFTIINMPSENLQWNFVTAIHQDRQGYLWLGTLGGLSRYKGTSSAEQEIGPDFVRFTSRDGLSSNIVNSIGEDRRGHLWIGTWGGGVTRYDGLVFQHLTMEDGLPANTLHNTRVFNEDRHGNIWITTTGGLVRYRPGTIQPPVFVTDVQTDIRHGPVDGVRLPSSQRLLAFEYQGISFRTRPGQMAYAYRLAGYQDEWDWTREKRLEFTDLPIGQYTFEVKAVDRDLNYSATPAQVAVEVFYQPLTSPVRLAAIELEDLYASYYQTYAQRPLGQVEVANDAPTPVEATLSFFLPGIMSRRHEIALHLEARAVRRVDLRIPLGLELLEVEGSQPAKAEIELAFAGEGETLSRKQSRDITVHGRGVLRWDEVGRAAAFITPSDGAVADFARPLLVAFEEEINQLGTPLRNLTQAMVLFEGLKAHGVRYVPDPNRPYAQVAGGGAVDHVQLPAELLRSKAGDCDDLTVLFCALLENAGVATALVDYPAHVFLLLDTGLGRRQIDRLPLEEGLYLAWGDRLWIPLETTLLAQSFAQAWSAGAEQLASYSDRDQHRLLVATATAWEQYPPVAGPAAVAVAPPAPAGFRSAFDGQLSRLQNQVDDYIDQHYIFPLRDRPNDAALREGLLKLYLELRQYDTAVDLALDYLIDEKGDKARIRNQLGIAYLLKGEIREAALHFKEAVALRPEDKGLQHNLTYALAARDRPESTPLINPAEQGAVGQAKGANALLTVDSFYWVE